MKVPEQDAVVPSVTGLWRGADWFERYCFDMYGIRFTDHPDLRRLLMYDEFVGYPLRKDYPLRDASRSSRSARSTTSSAGPGPRRATRPVAGSGRDTVTDHKGPGGLDTQGDAGELRRRAAARADEQDPLALERASSTRRCRASA